MHCYNKTVLIIEQHVELLVVCYLCVHTSNEVPHMMFVGFRKCIISFSCL